MVRVLSESGFSIQIDRTRCRPWGIGGGTDGEGADGRIEPAGGEPYRLLKGVTELGPGDRFRLRTGGGGGFGPPESRDPDRVADDVAAGYVSREKARDVYRVALDETGAVEAAETETAQAGRVRDSARALPRHARTRSGHPHPSAASLPPGSHRDAARRGCPERVRA